MPPYLTTAEVAALCRTSPETVRFWRYVGKGPTSFKLGRKVLYDADAVEGWLKKAQQAGAEAGPIAS
jgi:Helix-turn-helix domain